MSGEVNEWVVQHILDGLKENGFCWYRAVSRPTYDRVDELWAAHCAETGEPRAELEWRGDDDAVGAKAIVPA